MALGILLCHPAPDKIVSIAITTQPTTRTYEVNSSGNVTFSFTGAVVTATYKSGKTENITSSVTWSPTTDSITTVATSKTTTVTATFEGFTATTTMTVTNPLTSIAITTQPTTRTYEVNNLGNASFNFTGAVITATFKNGTTKTVTPTWNPTTGSITTATATANVTVTASYTEASVTKTTTTTMTLNNPLQSIAITIQPTTRTYTVDTSGNATFSFAGAAVTATYKNSQAAVVTSSTTWSPSSGSITTATPTATATVTASYGGKTATTTMTMNNPVTSISITTQPTTRTYRKGATFSSSGAVVTATFKNTKSGTVTATWSPTTLSTVGTQTMTASYTGGGATKTATTTVTVQFIAVGYQQVASLKNTSNVIVDTGFKPNNNTRVTARLAWNSISNDQWGGIGAAGASWSETSFETYVYSNTVNWNFNTKTYGADGSLGYTGVTVNTIYRIDANKNVYTIKNDSNTQLKKITATNGTFSCPNSLYLFGSHRTGTTGYGRCTFYDVVKIYNNGTLVRNMVPCYRTSDSVTGFYDTVNSKFYARSGLTKGSNVNVEV